MHIDFDNDREILRVHFHQLMKLNPNNVMGLDYEKKEKSMLMMNDVNRELNDRYQNRYAWLEKNHVTDVGSQYKSLGKQVDHKPSTWRCEDQAEAGKEFLRINDECADKIYDIRERSDYSRECLLNSDGVASRFYQMEADALKNRYELNNMKRKLDGIKQLRARLFK